jgi:hypothetical protein
MVPRDVSCAEPSSFASATLALGEAQVGVTSWVMMVLSSPVSLELGKQDGNLVSCPLPWSFPPTLPWGWLARPAPLLHAQVSQRQQPEC